jgi:hypothetical protein
MNLARRTSWWIRCLKMSGSNIWCDAFVSRSSLGVIFRCFPAAASARSRSLAGIKHWFASLIGRLPWKQASVMLEGIQLRWGENFVVTNLLPMILQACLELIEHHEGKLVHRLANLPCVFSRNSDGFNGENAIDQIPHDDSSSLTSSPLDPSFFLASRHRRTRLWSFVVLPAKELIQTCVCCACNRSLKFLLICRR